MAMLPYAFVLSVIVEDISLTVDPEAAFSVSISEQVLLLPSDHLAIVIV
jgi:hypothetical protein